MLQEICSGVIKIITFKKFQKFELIEYHVNVSLKSVNNNNDDDDDNNNDNKNTMV